MTKLVVCATFDVASQLFGRPFTVRAVPEAVRGFIDEVNRADQQNPLFQHPGDFELWVLGTYDEVLGEFEAEGTAYDGPAKCRIVRGAEVKEA